MPETYKGLLIEDTAEDAEYLRLLLEYQDEEKLEMRVETRLVDGLAALDEETFDVILLDLELPDCSGLETFLSIYRAHTHIPVVVLTGHDDEELALQAMEEGAQDYLIKGQMNSEMLWRALRYAIGRQRFMQEIRNYARQLIESEYRFRQIIAKNADMMVVIDETGGILYMNPAAEDTFSNVITALPAGFLPLQSEEMREVEFKVSEGDTRILQVRTVATEWEGEKAFLASIRDITLRRTAEKDVLQTLENERRRIGQELHDGLGQRLTALAFLCKAMQCELEREGSPAASKAQELASTLNETIEETERLSRGLYPIGLERAGLVSSLAELAKQTQRHLGIDCRFVSNRDELELNVETAFHLYRIAQEAVNNAIRHAGAKGLKIQISQHSSQLRLMIEDDGTGIKDTSERGMGLHNMEYRADLISAHLDVQAIPNKGTLVSVSLRFPDTPLDLETSH